MHVYGARGPLSDTPQLGEYEVVLAHEANAAITHVTAVAMDQILGADDDLDQAIKEAYLLGERDMLAKCISMIADIDDNGDPDIRYMLSDVTARLSNQPPLLPPSVGVPEKRGSLW